MANSVDPDQTAPIGAVCSGSTLFAFLLNLSVMLGNFLQQTTSADEIFRCTFFLATLWVNKGVFILKDTQETETGMFKVGQPATIVFFRSAFI